MKSLPYPTPSYLACMHYRSFPDSSHRQCIDVTEIDNPVQTPTLRSPEDGVFREYFLTLMSPFTAINKKRFTQPKYPPVVSHNYCAIYNIG